MQMQEYLYGVARKQIHNHNSIIFEKTYIHDPSEAPDGANVQEGPRGGLFYDNAGENNKQEQPIAEDSPKMYFSNPMSTTEKEWYPKMSSKEASEWNKKSIIKNTVFHGTSKSSAENIKNSGFRTDERGIYMTSHAWYAEKYSDGGSSNLPLKINVEKIFDATYEDINNAGGSASFFKKIEKQGYDGYRYIRNASFGGKVPDTLVIFDPKNIVVIEESEHAE